ncbi:helix-turn-helix transcriptional regulator [Actinocrispum sp. NPDC049592]|uniref:helix-turn-helix domain-containing protein n=1 Tax=Actinocrispum sp. NPDC049592 TaxID=3154835 RepID=UPI00343BB12A
MDNGPLPERLGDALRYGPFHRALREAIEYRGLSLTRLTAHLDRLGVKIGQSTLSYWQRGLRHPEVPRSVDTVRALETVLRLPSDSLVVLIGPRQRAGRHDEVVPKFTEVSRVWQDAPALLAEFDAAPETKTNADLRIESVHDFIQLGAHREQRSQTTRFVVTAARPGPDRYFATWGGDEGCLIDRVEIASAEGCRLGRVRRQPASGVMAMEFLFDRHLAEGETHVFCFTIADGSGGPSPGMQRTFLRGVGSYLIQLGFHRRAMPSRVVRQFRAHDQAEPVGREGLVCGLGRVSSGYFTNLPAGLAEVVIDWA